MSAQLALLTSAVLLVIQVTQIQSRSEAVRLCGYGRADVVFVLDKSSSIWVEDFKKEVSFVANLTDKLNVSPKGTWVGVEAFDEDAMIYSNLGEIQNSDDFKNRVKEIQQYGVGRTATHLALKKLREMYHYGRQGVNRVAVVITDGSSDIPAATNKEADQVHRENILVYVIAVESKGSYFNKTELEKIAGDKKNVFYLRNFDELLSRVAYFGAMLCPEETPKPKVLPQVKTTSTPAVLEICRSTYISKLYFAIPDHLSSTDTHLLVEFLRYISIFLREIPVFRRPYIVPRTCFATSGYGGCDSASNDFLAALDSLESETFIRSDLQLENIRKQEESYRRRYRIEYRSVLAVLILDSRVTNWDRMQPEVDLAKATGIEIVAIGVGDYVDRRDLLKMATSKLDVILVRSYLELAAIRKALIERVCYRVIA